MVWYSQAPRGARTTLSLTDCIHVLMTEIDYPLVTSASVSRMRGSGRRVAGRDDGLDVWMGRPVGRLSKRANRHFLVGRGPVVMGDG
jgi:hypothetical protein